MLQSLYSLAATGSFCWFVASSLWIYPHSLSYFNESVGGPVNGAEHLLGSAVDWGQDLRYILWSMDVKEFVTEPDNRRLSFHALYDPLSLGFPESYPVNAGELEQLASDGEQNKGGASKVNLAVVVYYFSTSFESGMRSNFRTAGTANDFSNIEKSNCNTLEYRRPITYSMTKAKVVVVPSESLK